MKSLNGLFGLRRYASNAVLQQDEVLQLWKARTVNNCNLVEMPTSVSNLLYAGEIRIFNFIESMNPLNVRKEMETVFRLFFNFGLFLNFERFWTKK